MIVVSRPLSHHNPKMPFALRWSFWYGQLAPVGKPVPADLTVASAPPIKPCARNRQQPVRIGPCNLNGCKALFLALESSEIKCYLKGGTR